MEEKNHNLESVSAKNIIFFLSPTTCGPAHLYPSGPHDHPLRACLGNRGFKWMEEDWRGFWEILTYSGNSSTLIPFILIHSTNSQTSPKGSTTRMLGMSLGRHFCEKPLRLPPDGPRVARLGNTTVPYPDAQATPQQQVVEAFTKRRRTRHGPARVSFSCQLCRRGGSDRS
jgi:hypothetical protein